MREPGLGRVDLHCHLLWGIDDGARTPEETLEIARALVRAGFRHVACSPHAHPGYPSNDPELCRRRLEEARALLLEHDLPLELHANAENLLDLELPTKMQSAPRSIGGGPWVLAEAPYLNRMPHLQEILFRLQVNGMRLLIAHPERSREFESVERARAAVRSGARFQLDLGSLVGRHGRTARKLARAFLADGLYSVAATDIHSAKDAEWLEEAIEELVARAGEEAAHRLLAVHPMKVLRGEGVEVAC